MPEKEKNINPWQEAALSMGQAGIGGLGDITPNFDRREQLDRMNYGQASWDAQKWNRPSFQEPGNTDRGPWLYSDSDMINPNVAERQYGLAAYPGAAKKWAEMYNNYYDWDNTRFSSPKQFRDVANWANAINIAPNIIDPMYQNLDIDSGWTIEDEFSGPSRINTDMYKSKREQIEDEDNSFVANMMEMYGRDNPYTQELGETLTDDTYIDRGTTIRPSWDFGYNYANDAPMTSPINQIYPDEKYLPSPYTPPSDRQSGFDYTAPALPPANLGFARAGDDPALPPEYFEFDRAGPGSDMMDFANLEDDEILRIMGQYGVDPEEARRLYDEMIYGYERDIG
jgi:hypothetical protein